MNAEEILARTFAHHEGEAPDPEAVLADVHARLSRRRRTVPVLAAAATVAAIAIGASVLVGVQQQSPSPASTPTPAAPTSTYLPPRTPSQPTPTPVDPLSTQSPDAAAQATVGIDAGWLPPGTAKQTGLYYFYGRQQRDYVVGDPGRSELNIELRLWTGTSLTPDEFLDPAPRDLTLNGRPAREWPGPDLYVVVLRAPGGRVAQVNVFSTGGRPPDVAAIGRHIATSLRLDRETPISPDFRPAYVPTGLVVRSVFVRPQDGTSWSLAAPHADPAGPGIVLVEDDRKATDSTVVGSPVPGRPVRGHPTHLFTEEDRVSLWVDGLVHGKTLIVTDEGQHASVAELYKVANGVRLIS
jgi:hypothetical protein